ncbi:MAG: hypothetical protein AAFW68_08930, partial [Pseudomonadota bacterium]
GRRAPLQQFGQEVRCMAALFLHDGFRLADGHDLAAAVTPEDVAKVAKSYTGKFLKPLLKGGGKGSAKAAAKKKTVKRKRKAA